MRVRSTSRVRVAAVKALLQRFSLAFLLVAAVGLLILGKVDTVLVDGARTRITDAVTPVLDALSRPAATVAEVVEDMRELTVLRTENSRLRAELAQLRAARDTASRLEAENLSLRMLLNYVPEIPHELLTARVIADNTGAFVRSVGVNVGQDAGVADGMTAFGSVGIVGRVVQAGARSARILLITDLNARVPVIVGGARQRAVMGGDNSGLPRLMYLPPDSAVAVGDRVVTSGHGGMFPAGLPVGTVASVSDGEIRVRPLEDLGRLEFVRIFGFAAGATEAVMRPDPSIAAARP